MSDEVKDGRKTMLLVVILVAVALLLSGGILGWRRWLHRHGDGEPQWLLTTGVLHGRLNPELEVRLRVDGQEGELSFKIPGRSWPFRKRDFGRIIGLGPMDPRWQPFAMVDGRDRIYRGARDGQILCWDGEDGKDVDLEPADLAAVRKAYREKTGRDWPEQGAAP